MSDFQNIKKQLLPLLKGLPIILVVFLFALFLARLVIKYSPAKYQTMAKIKLDNQNFGFSGTSLYKDFDVFSSEQKIEAEAELLKSPLIVGLAIDSLKFHIQIHRTGRLKKTLLYKDCPFILSYKFDNPQLFNREHFLKIGRENTVNLTFQVNGSKEIVNGKIGEEISFMGGAITIHRNEILLQKRDLNLIGDYSLKIFSRDDLVEDVISRLDVKAVDKEVAVLRVVYKDANPRKMADFTNVLCRTYIEDYVSTKASAAHQTLTFIDNKLLSVSEQLKRAEENLERFKLDNNVVNTLQETETGLREISKLNLQLINLEMNEKAVLALQTYISSGEYFDETAINFGFGDLLLTELVKKMKLWQDERKDLIIKYTEDSPQVTAVDGKILEVKKYIQEALEQNIKEMQVKRSEIETEVKQAKRMFDDLPTREKSQHILEREFRILEDVYNFLSQKKIESSIAESVQHSFHRIIQHARAPKDSMSPNKTLITFVSGLLGLILGISFIYIRAFVMAKVKSREDLEKNSTLPIAGIIRNGNNARDFNMLAKSILLKESIFKGQTISVTSALLQEGKSIEPVFRDQSQEIKIDSLKLPNLSPMLLKNLNTIYDIVIIDSLATAIDINGVHTMKMADLALFVFRTNHSSIRLASHADMLKEEYKIQNIELVLNDAHKATNYSGSYVGSKFITKQKSQGMLSRLQSLFQIYVKS